MNEYPHRRATSDGVVLLRTNENRRKFVRQA